VANVVQSRDGQSSPRGLDSDSQTPDIKLSLINRNSVNQHIHSVTHTRARAQRAQAPSSLNRGRGPLGPPKDPPRRDNPTKQAAPDHTYRTTYKTSAGRRISARRKIGQQVHATHARRCESQYTPTCATAVSTGTPETYLPACPLRAVGWTC
jgi:hypothetical protein